MIVWWADFAGLYDTVAFIYKTVVPEAGISGRDK